MFVVHLDLTAVSTLLFQGASTEASRCSADWTHIRAGSDFVEARLSSRGSLACNFTLQAAEGSGVHAAGCDPDGASGTAFVCQIRGLLPGTPYRLTAVSSGDGGWSSATVRTGEFAARSSPSREEPARNQIPQTWLAYRRLLPQSLFPPPIVPAAGSRRTD